MILIIILVSLLLSLTWFHDGIPFGSGESGILFINPGWHLEATRYAWKSSLLGNVVGITTASSPTYWLLSVLEKLGGKDYLFQAIIVFIVFVTSGIGIYLLTRELFPKLNRSAFLVAVLFYWFNPFSLVNIWNRFINNYIVFFGMLPLALFLFIKGVKNYKPVYALGIGILSLIFSFAFTSLPFNLLMWLLFLYTTIFYFFVGEKKNRIKVVKFFVLTLIIFVLLNLWWISQLFSLTTSGNLAETFNSFFTTAGNLSTLTVLSDKLGQIQNLLRFKHGTFFSESSIWWRQVYDFGPIKAIEFIVPGIILYIIWKKRKNYSVLYLATLFFIGIFLSKGNALPLGEVFEAGFTKISSLQVFRNPFEKFGLLMTLSAAPLFAIAFHQFRHIKKLLILCTVVLVLWTTPFITGLVFSGSNTEKPSVIRSYKTIVPRYYEEINNFFKNLEQPFRFLLFPIGGEGITYNWQNQYSGIELSASIFESPNIGLNTTIPYFDKVVRSLEKLLFTHSDFYKVAGLLNVNYLVVREDIDWRARAMRNPALVLDLLNSNNIYQQVEKYGQMTIYKIKDSLIVPKIWIPKSSVNVGPDLDIENMFLGNFDQRTLFYSSEDTLPSTISEIKKPFQTIYFADPKKYSVDDAKAQLLYAKNLPGSPLYFLSIFKENSERLSQKESSAIFIHDLTHLGKRAMEIYRLAEINNATQLKPMSENYLSLLNSYKELYSNNFKSTSENFSWNMIVEEFTKHNVLFNDAYQKADGNTKVVLGGLIENVEKWTKEVGIKAYYTKHLESKPNENIWIYRYMVDKEGEYELYLSSILDNKFFVETGSNITVQLNEKLLKLDVIRQADRSYLGKIYFQKGLNELWLKQPVPKNLLNIDQILLDSNNISLKTEEITGFDPFANYIISFDYWIKKGKSFEYDFVYDNDSSVNGESVPGFSKVINTDGYINDYKNETLYFAPRSGANQMSLNFKALELNDCKEQRNSLSPSCSDPSFSRLFNKQTEVEVRNVKVYKVFDTFPFISQAVKHNTESVPGITFTKVNPARYDVSITNATEPYNLVFSETFNSGWKLLLDGRPLPSKHFLANTYANAWTIDYPGSYKLSIIFEPQNILYTTQQISIAVAVAVFCSFIYLLWRRKF